MAISERYRHRIFIDSRVETRGEFGEVAIAWEDAFPSATAAGGIPAEVLTGPGRELRAAGAFEAEQSARINFRHLPGVDQTMRVRWGSMVYDIQSVEYDATARIETRLICKAGLSSGT